MKYVASSLSKNEDVKYTATLHWSQYIVHVALMVALIGFITIWIPVVRTLTTEMVVTNKRVIAKTGLLSLRTLEIRLSKVETIGVKQGLLGRFLNYGIVTVRGTGGTSESFKWIAQPFAFRKAVQDLADDAAEHALS